MGLERFPDKIKPPGSSLEDIAQLILLRQKTQETRPLQTEATWNISSEYPDLPVVILFATDVHLGADDFDLSTFMAHASLVETSPNTYVIFGGDMINNMSSKGKSEEDCIPPELQAELYFGKLLELDEAGNLGALQLGEHDGWSPDLIDSYLKEFSAPIFPASGGQLLINLGDSQYAVGLVHHYPGRNGNNITNAGKEALYKKFSNNDGVLIGHDHRMSGEIFIGDDGQKHFVISGGTYKHGLGESCPSGMSLMLWPDKHEFALMLIEPAVSVMNKLVGAEE